MDNGDGWGGCSGNHLCIFQCFEGRIISELFQGIEYCFEFTIFLGKDSYNSIHLTFPILIAPILHIGKNVIILSVAKYIYSNYVLQIWGNKHMMYLGYVHHEMDFFHVLRQVLTK